MLVLSMLCVLAYYLPPSIYFAIERQWNMWIPGFGSEEIRPYKKACTTEAHKQVRTYCLRTKEDDAL